MTFEALPNRMPRIMRAQRDAEQIIIDVEQVRRAVTEDDFGTWAAYTSTTGNITETSGTKVSRYRQYGKSVEGYFHFTLGASSAVGTSPTFTLPVEASASYKDFYQIGTVSYRDITGNVYMGGTGFSGTSRTVASMFRITSEIRGQVNATAPFTWATGDYIMVEFRYEAA